MATMKQELTELKVRVERLEATVRRLTNDECQDSLSAPGESSDQEQCLTWLKTQGANPRPDS